MSEKIEAAKKVIMDLQEALRVHVNMALCCEKPTVETDAMYQIVVDRANNWLSSIEPPLPVSVWEPHQQRVWIEKQELDERAWKLTEFVGGDPLFRKLTYEDQQLLYEQRRLMYQLSEVLDQRIKRFFPQEAEAVTVSVSMVPGAEPLSAEKVKELDQYLDTYLQQKIEAQTLTKEDIQKLYDLRKADDNRMNDLQEASKPLVQYLREHGNPHMRVIVEQTHVELVEGVIGIHCPENL